MPDHKLHFILQTKLKSHSQYLTIQVKGLHGDTLNYAGYACKTVFSAYMYTHIE
jgi:hypothetical protein